VPVEPPDFPAGFAESLDSASERRAATNPESPLRTHHVPLPAPSICEL